MESAESCDVKLFHLNVDDTTYDGSLLKKVNRTEAPVFFRFGFYNYVKVNAERKEQWLGMRPVLDTWYRFDLLLDWDKKDVELYVDGVFQRKFDFFQAVDRFWFPDKPEEYNGVNSLVLYNLSPGVTSIFADV